jgi:hypothetical protein
MKAWMGSQGAVLGDGEYFSDKGGGVVQKGALLTDRAIVIPICTPTAIPVCTGWSSSRESWTHGTVVGPFSLGDRGPS